MKFLSISPNPNAIYFPSMHVQPIHARLQQLTGPQTMALQINCHSLRKEDIDRIVRTCPRLVHFKCTTSQQSLWSDSSCPLAMLHQLQSLDLNVLMAEINSPFNIENVKSGIGQLKELEFLMLNCADQLDMKTILAMPALTTLACQMQYSIGCNMNQNTKQIRTIIDKLARRGRTLHFHECFRWGLRPRVEFENKYCADPTKGVGHSAAGDFMCKQLMDNVVRSLCLDLPEIPATKALWERGFVVEKLANNGTKYDEMRGEKKKKLINSRPRLPAFPL